MGKLLLRTIFDTTHHFSSDVGFTNIVVQSMGQSGAETKYRVPIRYPLLSDRQIHFTGAVWGILIKQYCT